MPLVIKCKSDKVLREDRADKFLRVFGQFSVEFMRLQEFDQLGARKISYLSMLLKQIFSESHQLVKYHSIPRSFSTQTPFFKQLLIILHQMDAIVI